MSNNWKWNDEDNKALTVFPTVSAVAVYTNPDGDIVVRQEGYMGGDDSIIVIPRIHAGAVISAIQAELEQEAN